MTTIIRSGLLVAALLAFNSCSIYTPEVEPRPDTWAKPIEAKALPNLHQVSPDLYRCALPKSEGYDAARELGINTVVNLRPKFSADEDRADPPTVHIPVRTSAPTYEEARRFFEVVDNPSNTPVLLHCYHGADRTGAFTALYRINRQGWTADQAIDEMTGGGYHFHSMWKSLIPWIREAPEF